MTIQELDNELSLWQSKLAVATDNLLAFKELPAFKRLSGLDGWPPVVLEGETKARVEGALAGADDLFTQLLLVKDVIDRATAMRRPQGRGMVALDRIQDIMVLLQGESIELPPEEIPLAQRGLLAVGTRVRRISPAKLLGEITQAYEAAKDAVVAADSAWNGVAGEIEAARRQIESLSKLGQALGAASVDVSGPAHALDALAPRIVNDPLGAKGTLDREILPALTGVRTALGDIARERQEVETGLTAATDLLCRLETVHMQCQEAYETCRTEVDDPRGLVAPIPGDSVEDLSTWLDALKDAAASKKWHPARVGLVRWNKETQKFLDQESSALTANRAPLDRLAELRGQFSALQAKAGILAARGAVLDEQIRGLEMAADSALREKPLSISRITELVASYEQRLLWIGATRLPPREP